MVKNRDPVEFLRKKYSGKNVLVLGIGALGGGVGVAHFFVDIGAKVVATDLKSNEQLDQVLLKQLEEQGVKLELGGHSREMIDNADLVIRNPAVSRDSEFVLYALEKGIPVEMEIALFTKVCPAPIIGITGTRGKTTTCNMIYVSLQAAGHDVLLGGNIHGISTLELLYEVKEKSIVVLELSSWALQGFANSLLSPTIAVITNIYPDHLNRYSDMQSYIEDKQAIFANQKNQDVLFLNNANGLSNKFAKMAGGKVKMFSIADLPKDYKLQLPGDHNRENAAAALAVTTFLGLDRKNVLSELSTFSGVPYRLEIVAEINGVTYINDTTSTTPTSVIAALNAFKDKPIVLILGGADKNLPLNQLTQAIKNEKQIKHIIYLKGDGTQKLLKSLCKEDETVYDNLEQALSAAASKTKRGDYVLFSPGFTSFSMFRNEFDRGDQFNQIIKSINAKD